MASRTVFQMDQTASANQEVLWYFRKRSEDSNLDCRFNLCAGRNREKETRCQVQSLLNIADRKHHAFRENTHFIAVCGYG
jgi:hypothetical protein